jgi:hypothetical protein
MKFMSTNFTALPCAAAFFKGVHLAASVNHEGSMKYINTFRIPNSENLFILFFLILMSTYKICGQTGLNPVSPLQTGHYMPGLLNIRDFADPSPATGLFVLDYNTYQYGDRFYGSEGEHITQIKGPDENPVDLKSDVDGYFNSPMLLWASKGKVLGATYFGGISVPIVTVNTNLAYARIGNINDHHDYGDISGKVSGLSDLNVMPLYLSWVLSDFNITAGYMFYAPTGEYTPGGSDNTGLGYWSNVFQTFGYWYPEKTKGKASQALALMLGLTYEVTGEIKDSDVNPGNRFSLDYGIEQYFTDKLSVGLYGGNNWQISEDKGREVYWNSKVKDRLGVAGVQLAYWLWPDRFQLISKWGFSYGAVERYQQNDFALNLIFISNALTGGKKEKSNLDEAIK